MKVKKQLQYQDLTDYYITSTGRVFSSKTKFEYQTLDKVNYGCIAWKELKPTIVRGI